MSIGKLHEFNVSNGAWSSYMDRVEMYYKVNVVEEDMKVPILIAAMGDEAYELLENLASPKKPATLTLAQINDLMAQHLQPAPSVLAERYRFRQRRQKVGETISTYVAELKRLSKHCKFGSNLSEDLRDQFVCGLSSDVIRQRLFAEDDKVTFTAAVKLATSLEAAERDAAIVEQTKATGSSGTGEVQAVMFASRGRPSSTFGGAQVRAPAFTSQRRSSNGRQERHCEACGARSHNYVNCKFRDYVCSKCQRTGHLRRVCPDWGAGAGAAGRGGVRVPARRGGPAAAAPARNAIYFGDADRESSEEHGGDIEEELHHLCLNNYQSIIWCVVGVLAVLWVPASGHGRLTEPPSRASAWRFGFDTPHNYNDHELYCGGFTRQWKKNEGKCGVCGDAWDSPVPRAHELGGRFGKGVIVRKYAPQDPITIKVELTANHHGFFEFRVCEEPKATTQECLDKNVLKIDGRDGTKFYPRDGNKVYEMKYRLPEGLECAHCVLQWRYIAGNNWGTCENGTGAVGCGPQEEFRACADIAIGDRFATTTRRPRPSYVPSGKRPTVPMPEESNSGSAWYGVVVAVVALLVAVSVLAGFYLYYYRGGMRIKSLLKKTPPPAPVPPPRHKRSSLSREHPPELTTPKVATISDSGFETVDLRAK